MSDFDKHWQFIVDRKQHGVTTVQDRSELEHVYNLMKAAECKSYLEVGTAEGNSLYVLSHAVSESVESIDFCEEHTAGNLKEVMDALLMRDSPSYIIHKGDSTRPETHPRNCKYDAILIDGGHDYATVLSDSILYAPLATKYVFWHDIQLPEVKAAVDWFMPRWNLGRYSTFINSDSFGYGILEIGK